MFCNRMTDPYTAFTSTGEAHLTIFTCAYLSSLAVVLHLRRLSLETEEAKEIKKDDLTGTAASLITIILSSF